MKPPNTRYRSFVTAPRAARVLISLALIVGGIFGFLPILGFWMIPLGFLVIFFEVPWVRGLRRRIFGWWKARQNGRSRRSPADGP